MVTPVGWGSGATGAAGSSGVPAVSATAVPNDDSPIEGKRMSEQACLILHRKSANEPRIKEAVKSVRSKGIDLRVRIPWNKRDKSVVVKEALEAGSTRLVAGGGDGTINAVVNALVGNGVEEPSATMGVLPLGTANDFAHGLGLPVEDLGRCLEIACTAPAKQIDVGRANRKYFINVASGGFGAEITATTPVGMKKALGGGAYTIMGMIKAFNLEPYEGRLLVPGEAPVEGSMLLMAVGNSRLAGGGFEVAPDARLDDGMLDLAVLRYTKDGRLGDLARELKSPTSQDNVVLLYRQLSEFTLEGKKKLNFNLDGEPVLKRKLRFSVLPQHLGVAF
jgi:lipid kinase YegS